MESMMKNLKMLTSERGKDPAVLNNDICNFVRQRKDGLMKWKRSNNSCNL